MASVAKTNPFIRLYQQLASIGGAIALLQIFRDLIELKEFFRDLVDAWSAIVRPIGEFLLGWLDLVFRVRIPRYVHDYMIVGFILFMGAIRGEIVYDQSVSKLRVDFEREIAPFQRRIRNIVSELPPLPKDASVEQIKARDDDHRRREQTIVREMEPIYEKFGFKNLPEKALGIEFNQYRPITPWIERFVSTALFWPLTYFAYVRNVLSIDWSRSPISKWEFLFDLFAPFLYFLIIVMANYFLFIY